MSETSQTVETPEAAATGPRKKLLGIFALVVIAIAAAYTAYWYFIGSRSVSTDNAYTGVEEAQVTPAIPGIVKEVKVHDTQYVHKGDVLARLDDIDARIALESAHADLEMARRRVMGYMAMDENLTAQVDARKADQMRAEAGLTAARANLERAQLDYKRRKNLLESGSVSAEDLSNARSALTSAEANLRVAESALTQSKANFTSSVGAQKANQVHILSREVSENPEVKAAMARLQQAEVNMKRTVIHAPVDGVVANRMVQVGKKVQPGEPLMIVVPTAKIYVDANFKEVQLTHVKPGQDVTLTADIYGDDVVYHGKVTGFSGGTGSAFSMIPAQNATGNWIKVVQRLPVRISLDPEELKAHPLRVGLSMEAEVDISGASQQASNGSVALAETSSDR